MHVWCLIDRWLQASQGDTMGAAHVYLASEKRLLSASVTLHVRIHTWIPILHGHTCAHAQRGSFELARAHASPARRAQQKGMPLSADVRAQVCVPLPLAPFVSSSSPEAAHLSAAPFHFIPLQPPPHPTTTTPPPPHTNTP